jgi:DNA helicase-2/ATP-dependent DNA helicase PcrA
MEIKDVLGYLKLGMNPTDDMAVKRVINVPARGIVKILKTSYLNTE